MFDDLIDSTADKLTGSVAEQMIALFGTLIQWVTSMLGWEILAIGIGAGFCNLKYGGGAKPHAVHVSASAKPLGEYAPSSLRAFQGNTNSGSH
jgi:hypothetical protein